MTAVWHRRVTALCVGSTLSTFFFYPLLAAFDSGPYYLQWRLRDTWELAAAGVGLALLCAAVESRLSRATSARVRWVGRVALAAVPVVSFASTLGRGVLAGDQIITPRVQAFAPFAVVVLLWAIAAVTYSAHRAARFAYVLSQSFLVLSPIVFVFLLTGFRMTLASTGHTGWEGRPADVLRAPSTRRPAPGIFVLLFDELSYRFLYQGERSIGSSLKHLSGFERTATAYHAATSPASSTIGAVVGLLTSRRGMSLRPEGRRLVEVHGDESIPVDFTGPSTLVGLARARGFRVEVFGWYNPYCELFGDQVDACRAVSMYNTASADDRFSLWHPFATTFNLWPHQWPTGMAKNPAALAYHRAMLDLLTRAASTPTVGERPVLRLVHFNIAHGPFLGACRGVWCDPFEPSDENYRAQLGHVDETVGRVRTALEQAGLWEASVVVVLSDHELRRRAPAAEHAHVPLIVKAAGQTTGRAVWDPVQTEVVLREAVQAFRW